MAGQFEGKVVVVTGGAGNLGRAVTRRFHGAGARLVLLDHNMDRLRAFADELGGEIFIHNADLSDSAQVDACVAEIEGRFGQIDILAHTVGGYEAGTPVHETPVEVFERQLALNVRPIYVFCGRVARHMVTHNVQGKIVIVLARAANKGSLNHGAYTASKAAAQRIMESMALELRDKGINVNAVLPSTLDTPPNRQSMPNADFSKWVTPEDMANSIAFLASPEARSLFGVNLEVYGRA